MNDMLTADMVRRTCFPMTAKGYDTDIVDMLLDDTADRLDRNLPPDSERLRRMRIPRLIVGEGYLPDSVDDLLDRLACQGETAVAR